MDWKKEGKLPDYCGFKKYLDRLAVLERVDGGYERGQLRKQLSAGVPRWSTQGEAGSHLEPVWL